MADPVLASLIERLRILRVQEAAVIDQIERINNNNPLPDTVIRDGDRVRIVSQSRVFPGQSRTGRVTRVTADRVYLITDDGTHTWRKLTNVVKLL
jgi:hypothetical protein